MELDFATIVETISGLVICIYTIYRGVMKAFGDIGVLKKYKDKKEEAVRQKRKKEYLEDMKEGINHMVQPMVDELKANNVEQNKKLEELLRSSNDLLRKEITRIYYKYLPYQKLPRYVKEELHKLHDDYKAQGGNSFVDDIWVEMVAWTTVSTEEEVRK